MPAHDVSAAEAVVIEADTAEEALALVRDRLGDDAEVLEARKVQRGGWKGFFTLERVELTARAPAPASLPAAPPAPVPAAPPAPSGGDRIEDLAATRRVLDEEEQQDRADFDRMLRRLLEPEPTPAPTPTEPATMPVSPEPRSAPVSPESPLAAQATTPTPTPGPVDRPVPTPDEHQRRPARTEADRPASGIAWSCRALEELRVPAQLVEACRDLDPGDDPAWIAAIADVVAPWCRPLPAGPPAYVGPQLGRLARALDVPVVRLGATRAPAGPVALQTPDTPEGRAWAARLAGDRWLHVVAAGRRWQGFVFDDALAVSWVGDGQVPMAMSVASRLGLVLGHGSCGGVTPLVRTIPVDVALAIRALLPRT